MSDLSLVSQNFQPPKRGGCDLLIIAGEHSGDQHAARLLVDVKKKSPTLSVCALGGEELKKSGADLLYDLTSISVVGFVEVLKHYAVFKDVFERTLAWIRRYRPKKICLVDYPGFNLRLADALYREGLSIKGGGDIEVCFYIGPQIWAWKAHRRFTMARLLDKLAVIFPFEVNCYKDTDLPVTFVGHPFLEKDYTLPLAYDERGAILLLPGSRKQAVSRIFPVILDAYREFRKKNPNENAIVIYPDNEIKSLLVSILRDYDDLSKCIALMSHGEFVRAKAVLMSSGTMSLKCALAGVPGAIVYKSSVMTNIIGRLFIKIPYLGIANILLDKEVYPEYIQWSATPTALASEISACISNPMRIDAMSYHKDLLRAQLSSSATVSASEWLMGK